MQSRDVYLRLLNQDRLYLSESSKVLFTELQYKKMRVSRNDFALRNEIKALDNKIMQIEFQLAKLNALSNSNIDPIFYTSIQTGETVYLAPPQVDLSQNANVLQLPPVAPAPASRILFARKQPRSDAKLLAKSSPNINVENDRPRSVYTLVDVDGAEKETVESEHKPRRHDGDRKYPHGGMCSKVKQSTNIANYDERAIKTFVPTPHQEKLRFRALRSKYLSEKVLHHPSEVGSHGGQLMFFTPWHKPLTFEYVWNLSVKRQLKFMLEMTYQVALFHQLDLLVLDLKFQNFVYTGKGAKMIDLDAVVHIKELEANNLSFIVTTQYLDDEALIARIVKDNFAQYLQAAGKQTDVYLLGILFVFLFNSLIEHKLGARTTPAINSFLWENEGYAHACERVIFHKKPAALAHPELIALLDDLTNQDRKLRPASAVEVYQRLRKIALDKNYLTEAELPPELTPVTQADSHKVYEELQLVNKASENDDLPAFVCCNKDISFHQNTPDNAVRYDFQTLRNIRFREKILQLGPAKVNISAQDKSAAKTNTRDITIDDTSAPPIIIREREKEIPNNNQQNNEAEDLKRLTKLFKQFVGHVIKISPNIDSKHGKYTALKDFNEIVKNIKDDEYVTSDELKQLAKSFFQLSLSHIRFDFINTTETGLKCRTALAESHFNDLKNFLFPERNPDTNQKPAEKRKLEKEGVRYRDIRRLVCGKENNTKFFSHRNTKTDLQKWNAANISKDTTLNNLLRFNFRI